MTNKSRGDFAYTLLDLGSKLSDQVISEIEQVDGVIKIRVVK
jgi:D-3-phosphoglycerate dehydrogenase